MSGYELWYWPGIPGRGEFVRLALEADGIPYRDVALDATVGEEGLIANLKAREPEPFAPPYLVADGLVIAQVANILLWLGDRHGLAPADPAGRHLAQQYQLTIADMVAEAHDAHHPIDPMAYYEEQKPEAARRADVFRRARMTKYLGYFERALERGGDWLADARWTYADTSLFQLIEGLTFAFPERMKTLAPDHPRLLAHRDRVRAIPGIAAYLASGRRQAFGEGIFRHYPELDAA